MYRLMSWRRLKMKWGFICAIITAISHQPFSLGIHWCCFCLCPFCFRFCFHDLIGTQGRDCGRDRQMLWVKNHLSVRSQLLPILFRWRWWALQSPNSAAHRLRYSAGLWSYLRSARLGHSLPHTGDTFPQRKVFPSVLFISETGLFGHVCSALRSALFFHGPAGRSHNLQNEAGRYSSSLHPTGSLSPELVS